MSSRVKLSQTDDGCLRISLTDDTRSGATCICGHTSVAMTSRNTLQWGGGTRAAPHLRPADAAVVLGAVLGVRVLHQRQVFQRRAPAARRLRPRAPPQQAHRHVGGVVVLEDDLVNLKHAHDLKKTRTAPEFSAGASAAGSAAYVDSFPKRKVDVHDADAGASRRLGSDVQVNGRFDGAAHGLVIHPISRAPETGSDERITGTPLMQRFLVTSPLLEPVKCSLMRSGMFYRRRKVGIKSGSSQEGGSPAGQLTSSASGPEPRQRGASEREPGQI